MCSRRGFVMMKAVLLLYINITSLMATTLVVRNLGLPGLDLGGEYLFHIFKCLARSLQRVSHALFEFLDTHFWEAKEDVDEHSNIEAAENEVRLPLDVYESWRNEV